MSNALIPGLRQVPEFFIKTKIQPMKKVIPLKPQGEDFIDPIQLPERVEKLIEKRKNAKREPLTPEKIRKTPGLENLTDQEVEQAIDSIKRLTAILFEISCQKETTCIDNQQVVYSSEQKKAA